MKINETYLLILAISSSLFLGSCSEDNPIPDTPVPDKKNIGEVTTAVIVVNPVINEGSSTNIPTGSIRRDVALQVGNMSPVTTDFTGLAVVSDIPTGNQFLKFYNNGSLPFDVVNPGELYDLIVSYTDTVAFIVPVVRYPITGPITELGPGDDLNAAASNDNAVLFLEEGVYEGDVTVSGKNVLIFGAWNPIEGPTSILEGSLTFNGGSGRVRGLEVKETITVKANNFSAAFSNFNNAQLQGNDMVLLRNNFTGQSVAVPSSSAVLLDNVGID